MKDEESQNQENNLSDAMKEFIQKIAEMRAVQFMIENAPKDSKGNAVVSIVGIKNFGMFYLFEN